MQLSLFPEVLQDDSNRQALVALLPQLDKALAIGGNGYTIQDVLEECHDGSAQLWLQDGAVIVTRVNDYPTGIGELVFWIAAGEMQKVLALADHVYEWGRRVGCSRAVFVGRKGWAKVLGEHGWNPKLTAYWKEL